MYEFLNLTPLVSGGSIVFIMGGIAQYRHITAHEKGGCCVYISKMM